MSDSGDPSFDVLVERYGRLISAVVARVARGRLAGAREDVEQKVLFSLWKRLSSEQTIDPSSSYVYRAAVREAVRALREVVERAEDPLDDDDATAGAAPESDPFAALISKERLGQIEAALGALTLERRQAVKAHLAGFDVAEIMRLHGWSYQRARNLIARGMADLRRELGERGIHG